jgi:hypothetical protein
MIDGKVQTRVPTGTKKDEFALLTDGAVGATYSAVTTPGSFGERVQSHSERSGSCFFRGCP